MIRFFSVLSVFMVASLFTSGIYAQITEDFPTNLPRELTEEEKERWHEVGMFFNPTVPPESVYRSIAEFERNEGVLIRYSVGAPLAWPLDLIATFSEHVKVYTLVADASVEAQATNVFSSAGVDMDNVIFIQHPTNSVWTRDYGPFYIVNENHQISILDFIYNRPRPFDDAVPETLADVLNLPFYGMDVIHTGGNYMTDSWGIAASTDLIWEENQGDTLFVENRMREFAGIEKYVATEDPQQTYLKHIDTWAKYLDVDKIMIARVPQSNPNYQLHEEVVAYFQSLTSGYGTPYQIFRVDTPMGQPYTNALILNERVYVPITGSATWDQRAIEAYEEALPGYEILGFRGNPSFDWLSTDALHCRVKEIPDRGMLSLRHIPYSGEVNFTNELDFEIDIRPHSGFDLISDSLFLMISINEADFDTLLLSSVDDVRHRVQVPLDETVETISYYFFAADESGRREHFPLIGEKGARSFQINHGPLSAENEGTPTNAILAENYPNPFNPSTIIRFALTEQSNVRLEVFDITGRRIALLVDERLGKGNYQSVFDASNLSSGLYFYQIVARQSNGETLTATGKMTLIK